MKMKSGLSIALVAGSVFATNALAQKSVGRATPALPPVAKQQSLHLTSEVARPARAPDMIRSVKWVNGHIEPLSEWQPYHGGTGGADNPFEYVFDAMQDGPGVVPGTIPLTGRYTFYLETPGDAYTTAIRNFDMAGIPAAAQGQGAKVCDFLFREVNGAMPLYVGIFTAETADMANPPGATWGFFPGIQLSWVGGAGTGFWFSSADVSLQPPPVGDGWKMPVDGAGAYQFVYSRDPAGTQVAFGVQPGCWGTGATAQPPVPRVGTAGLVGQDDESTPPQCGATTIANNLPNFIVETAGNCEVYAWGPFAVPPPATTTLSPAIGFGMKSAGATGACCLTGGCQQLTAGGCAAANGVYQGDGTPCTACGPVCYPNCDGSTGNPCLTVSDFGCFLNAFAGGSSYANCDHSTVNPVLTVADFGCFLNAFAGGCSSC